MTPRTLPPNLRGLVFRAKALADGLYCGRHRSPHRGTGSDFYDFRPYLPGDPPAQVDWKLYGRTDRYYVRRFQRHSELRVHLVLDASASMGFASLDRDETLPTKLDYARLLGAAAAMLAVRQGDRVALSVCDTGVREHAAMSGGWGPLQRLLAMLERSGPGEGPGDLAGSLRQAQRLMPRRGLFVVLSDFLDEPTGLLDVLARLRHAGHHAALWQVLTPAELQLSGGPRRAAFFDPERPRRVTADLDRVRNRYLARIRQHIAAVRRGATARGAQHHLLRTDAAPLESLRRCMA